MKFWMSRSSFESRYDFHQKGHMPQVFSKLKPKLCACSAHLHPRCSPFAGVWTDSLHRAQEPIIYGQNGFLPDWIPSQLSPGIFQENKSAPCTKAVPGSTAFSRPPAPAPLAHNGLFQGDLSLGEARYCPGYKKLQFIKPGIRRKRRRRMHRGERTKKKKYFILKPPDQHTKKGPCPS